MTLANTTCYKKLLQMWPRRCIVTEDLQDFQCIVLLCEVKALLSHILIPMTLGNASEKIYWWFVRQPAEGT